MQTLENMKKYVDLGVSPITKLKNHFSNKEMDDLLYAINDKLYLFRNLYAVPSSRAYLKKEIENTGIALKQLSFTCGDKKIERRNEIVERLRDIYSKVNKSVTAPTYEYQEAVVSMNKYLTALYLKDKNEDNLTDAKKLEWIRKIKMFAEVYPICKNLESVQTELLKSFEVTNNFE